MYYSSYYDKIISQSSSDSNKIVAWSPGSTGNSCERNITMFSIQNYFSIESLHVNDKYIFVITRYPSYLGVQLLSLTTTFWIFDGVTVNFYRIRSDHDIVFSCLTPETVYGCHFDTGEIFHYNLVNKSSSLIYKIQDFKFENRREEIKRFTVSNDYYFLCYIDKIIIIDRKTLEKTIRRYTLIDDVKEIKCIGNYLIIKSDLYTIYRIKDWKKIRVIKDKDYVFDNQGRYYAVNECNTLKAGIYDLVRLDKIKQIIGADEFTMYKRVIFERICDVINN